MRTRMGGFPSIRPPNIACISRLETNHESVVFNFISIIFSHLLKNGCMFKVLFASLSVLIIVNI